MSNSMVMDSETLCHAHWLSILFWEFLWSRGGGGGWRGGGGGIAPGQETSILLKPINFRFNFKVVT